MQTVFQTTSSRVYCKLFAITSLNITLHSMAIIQTTAGSAENSMKMSTILYVQKFKFVECVERGLYTSQVIVYNIMY